MAVVLREPCQLAQWQTLMELFQEMHGDIPIQRDANGIIDKSHYQLSVLLKQTGTVSGLLNAANSLASKFA